nr:hypothetical protein CFP56_40398 [Quercus suber]
MASGFASKWSKGTLVLSPLDFASVCSLQFYNNKGPLHTTSHMAFVLPTSIKASLEPRKSQLFLLMLAPKPPSKLEGSTQIMQQARLNLTTWQAKPALSIKSNVERTEAITENFLRTYKHLHILFLRFWLISLELGELGFCGCESSQQSFETAFWWLIVVRLTTDRG